MKILIFISFILISASSFARPVRGTYEVPAPNELRAYSSFPVKFKSEEYDNGEKKLTFPLPIELTGQQTTLTMAEVTPGNWEGEKVSASCYQVGRNFECKMKFRNLQIDSAATTVVLQAKYPLETDLSKALELSEIFKSEPAGILRYRLRGGANP